MMVPLAVTKVLLGSIDAQYGPFYILKASTHPFYLSILLALMRCI